MVIGHFQCTKYGIAFRLYSPVTIYPFLRNSWTGEIHLTSRFPIHLFHRHCGIVRGALLGRILTR